MNTIQVEPLVAAARVITSDHLSHTSKSVRRNKARPKACSILSIPTSTHLAIRHPLTGTVNFLVVRIASFLHINVVFAFRVLVRVQTGRGRDAARARRRLSGLLCCPRSLTRAIVARRHRCWAWKLDAACRGGCGDPPFCYKRSIRCVSNEQCM